MKGLISNRLFKQIIVGFWAIWWFIAFITDLLGGLIHLNFFHLSWLTDGNYLFLVQSLSLFHPAEWITALFYIGIILWSGLCFVLFTWAALSDSSNQQRWLNRANMAFIVSLTFWLAFFIMDQIILKFDLEANHMVQGGFELLTYLSLYILPDKAKKLAR